MTDPYGERIYRIIFRLAGCYNLGFGTWSVLWPTSFFELAELDPPRYPAIWSGLGMVVGLYGLLYLYSARHLDRAHPIILVGLLGKVLGPAGFTVTVAGGELPLRAFPLIVFNDLIWWLPFSLFLLEGSQFGMRLRGWAPYACAVLHGLALAFTPWALLPGTLAETDWSRRAAHITSHTIVWRIGWAWWMISAVSLIAFYGWWGARIPSRRLSLTAMLLACAGLACDLRGESLYVAWLPELAHRALAGIASPDAPSAVNRFVEVEGIALRLTALWANGLYTIAGIVLTLGTKSLTGWLRAITWILWTAGIVMSVSALAGSTAGIIASSGVLFPLLVPWCCWLGWTIR